MTTLQHETPTQQIMPHLHHSQSCVDVSFLTETRVFPLLKWTNMKNNTSKWVIMKHQSYFVCFHFNKRTFQPFHFVMFSSGPGLFHLHSTTHHLTFSEIDGSLYYQPKQCIVLRDIPQKKTQICIVWFPPNGSHLMTPVFQAVRHTLLGTFPSDISSDHSVLALFRVDWCSELSGKRWEL